MHPRSIAPFAVAFLCLAGGTPRSLTAQASGPTLAHELDSLVVAVSRSDPRIAAGRASILAAEGRVRLGLPRDPLKLEVEVEALASGTSPLDAQDVKIGLASTLYRGGRAGATRNVQRASADGIRAQQAISTVSVESAIRLDLVGWLAWRGIEQRLTAQDRLFALAAEVLQTRFSVGEARYLDVLRLRTERLKVARERAIAAAEANAHLVHLRSLAAPDSALTARVASQFSVWERRAAWTDLPTLTRTSEAPSVDTMVAAIVAARHATIEAEAVRARADRNTAISGMLGLQRFQGESGALATGPTFGVSVDLPFSLTGTYGREREVISLRQASDSAALAGIESSWRAESDEAREAIAAVRARSRIFDDALLAGATEERESALAGFRAGSISLLELIDFERSLGGVERDRFLTVLEVIATDQALVEAATRSFASLASASIEGWTP